jgi:hypothetical protein
MKKNTGFLSTVFLSSMKAGLVLIFLCFFAISVNAQTYYSRNDGSYTAANMWSTVACGGPSCGCSAGSSTVEICSGTTVTFTGAYTVGPGGNVSTLIVDNGGTFITTGDMTFKNGSTVDVKSGGTLTVGGNFTNNNNSTGITIDGSMGVVGNASVGNGSTITGSGSVTVGGTTSGAGTLWGVSPGSCTGCSYSGSGAGGLPITLLSFTGEYTSETNIVTLHWTTSAEINNHYFVIIRSTTGMEWETISTVPGAGNSDKTINYTTTDLYPPQGVVYYKLEQIDFDGKSVTYPPVAVDAIASSVVKLFPNPASQVVYIQGDVQKVIVFNTLGQQVLEESGSDKNTSINIASLQSGLYLVQVTDAKGITSMLKFVKQ